MLKTLWHDKQQRHLFGSVLLALALSLRLEPLEGNQPTWQMIDVRSEKRFLSAAGKTKLLMDLESAGFFAASALVGST